MKLKHYDDNDDYKNIMSMKMQENKQKKIDNDQTKVSKNY